MCGIAGLIGKSGVYDDLVGYLGKLEYRGYDSAGVATVNADGKIAVVKRVGEVKNLIGAGDELNGKIGIAHTRWATHGKPSERNAHPHLSENGEWAVVHNGIIENADEIKSTELKGVKFLSSTDTEVIPNLLEKYCVNRSVKEFLYVTAKLKGSYALACVAKGGNKIFAAAKNSPLFVGVTEKGTAVSSDPIIFTRGANAYELSGGEIAVIDGDGVKFYSPGGEEIKKEPTKLDISAEDEDKGGYAHFMRKEIAEIPAVLKRISEEYSRGITEAAFKDVDKTKFDSVKFVGCGTAYNAACYGRDLVLANLGINATVSVASELLYSDEVIDDKTVVVAVSQSGETADTVGVMRKAKEKGALLVAVTNVGYSTLARMSDVVLPVFAGREIAVASTKAYVAQLAVLYTVIKTLAGKKHSLESAAKRARELESRDYSTIIDIIKDKNELFLLGRGLDYYTAEESALKIKEIAYVNANAYMSGELKHGFIALIEKGSAVVVYCTQKKLEDKCLSAVREVSARGAKVIMITPFGLSEEIEKRVFAKIELAEIDDELEPLADIIPWQIISYEVAVSKGFDPDKPRNLAKSVTVE